MEMAKYAVLTAIWVVMQINSQILTINLYFIVLILSKVGFFVSLLKNATRIFETTNTLSRSSKCQAWLQFLPSDFQDYFHILLWSWSLANSNVQLLLSKVVAHGDVLVIPKVPFQLMKSRTIYYKIHCVMFQNMAGRRGVLLMVKTWLILFVCIIK